VIDDATGALLHGVFAREEDAQSYLICLREILLEKGIPLALYMDRHGIFRRNDDHWSLQEQLAGEQTPTQVGQALRELGIKPIFALSPQAKGRVERLFNTLQDRLVQELRLAETTTAQEARTFLNGPFKADFNIRFAKPARESQLAWRPLPKGVDVDRICSFSYQVLWEMIMRFGWEEWSSTSLQDHVGRDTPKRESRCDNSSTAAGVSTTKTSCSWRQRRLLLCKHR
jgi:hypothetical protein